MGSRRELRNTTHNHFAMTATKTLYVSNFNDNGSLRNPLPGSLREAIKDGHEFAKDGYAINIVFQTDKDSEQINLRNSLHFKWGSWNINEGDEAKDITLNGNNKAAWAININHYIHRAPNQRTSVSVNQINVANFHNTDTGWYEGTIKNYSGSLTWRNSIFKNNTSTSGVVNSKSPKSDICLENIQFKDNTMMGGAKDANKITDENKLIVINDAAAKIETINIDIAPDATIIEAQSKIQKEGEFSLKGKYKLNPNKGYIIYQAIENGEKNMITPSSSNDEQLLGAIRQHASYTYRTKVNRKSKTPEHRSLARNSRKPWAKPLPRKTHLRRWDQRQRWHSRQRQPPKSLPWWPPIQARQSLVPLEFSERQLQSALEHCSTILRKPLELKGSWRRNVRLMPSTMRLKQPCQSGLNSTQSTLSKPVE